MAVDKELNYVYTLNGQGEIVVRFSIDHNETEAKVFNFSNYLRFEGAVSIGVSEKSSRSEPSTVSSSSEICRCRVSI